MGGPVNLLKDNIRNIYFSYLFAAFGSALISSIYGVVDMAMVGQYYGPSGTAALAVVAPVWNIIYSLGLLCGIGGSVLLSAKRGKGREQIPSSNEYFTVSMILSGGFALLAWFVLTVFEKEILLAFGADASTLPIAQEYLETIRYVYSVFLFNQMLAAYLRNDNAPKLATAAVMAGGIFNIFGDWFFVFACDFGAYGAGLATAAGASITLLILLSHFLAKKNTLTLEKPHAFFRQSRQVLVTGFSTFFIDLAMGFLTIMFNRQIMKYLNTDALAVYGVIVNISTFVQSCSYSTGQAAQPVLSMNYGAGNMERIRETLKYALLTSAVFAIFWTGVCMIGPEVFIRIFMSPTDSVLRAAPSIFRRYALSFLLLPFSIFSTYYFQALLKPKAAFLVSIGRCLVISGILICTLPLLFHPSAIWFAMPVTEAVTAVYAAITMHKVLPAGTPSENPGSGSLHRN
jgi:putative MATE family efflux protein